jgi:hypothetical protein
MAGPCRFDELRMRTAKELVGLINNELALGICEARQALRSGDPWSVAQEGCLRAKAAYDEASRLIPLAGEIAEGDRSMMESRLKDLQGMLEELLAIGSMQIPAEAHQEANAVCLAC